MATTAPRTPNAQDMALAMEEIERLGFEPVALINVLTREGHVPNGVAVGFRWLDQGSGPVETWSVWRWAIYGDGEVGLFEGNYDMKDRDKAIDHARQKARR